MANKKTSKRMAARSLLIEIGTEELPPKALLKLSESFSKAMVLNLAEAGLLVGDEQQFDGFAAPRRLAVRIANVLSRQPTQILERRGPALQAAFDSDGNPTRAAQGFAQSCGRSADKLARLKTDKGEWLVYRSRKSGVSLSKLLPDLMERSLKQLPIPKRMRWGAGDTEFVRPVHWLTVVYGSDELRINQLSVTSSRYSWGHRFHANKRIRISSAEKYSDQLQDKGYVIADFSQRREMIRKQVTRLAKQIDGVAMLDDALLNEVTALVEWPKAIRGVFDKAFLKVPAEALISSMRDHQKYFPITTTRGKLLPGFITVSNIQSKTPARVRAGNERVLRARLADAQFFWDNDKKQSLENRVESLRSLLFHQKLGSVYDKVSRVTRLAVAIACDHDVDSAAVERAAQLSKADLVSDMVGEFPDLQGVMGRYYALNDGEDKIVATAIADHYRPRFADDGLPSSTVGQTLALADKIDSLLGLFAAGEIPSGDKDRYALRRAALGVLKICIEQKYDLDLESALAHSLTTYHGIGELKIDTQLAQEVFEFLLDRLPSLYHNRFSSDEIQAVLSRKPARPLDYDRRIKALKKFRKRKEATDLAAANKRIANILNKNKSATADSVDLDLLPNPAEQALVAEFSKIAVQTDRAFDNGDYDRGLGALASLRDPIDLFFEQVMVMDDDPALRKNRLTLLQSIHQVFLRAADLSRLQG